MGFVLFKILRFFILQIHFLSSLKISNYSSLVEAFYFAPYNITQITQGKATKLTNGTHVVDFVSDFRFLSIQYGQFLVCLNILNNSPMDERNEICQEILLIYSEKIPINKCLVP